MTKNLEELGTLIFYKKLYEFKNRTENIPYLIKIFFIPKYFNNIDLIKKLIIWIAKGDFTSELIAKNWLKLRQLKQIKKI